MTPALSTLQLNLRDGEWIEFHVDGKNFGAIVESAFGEAGFDDVLPAWGGDYSIHDTIVGDPARQRGRCGAVFLACGCGQFACSGVTADVTLDASARTITWSNFRTYWMRKWHIAAIDPVTFDLGQYEREIRRVLYEGEDWIAAVCAREAVGWEEPPQGPDLRP